MLQIVCTGTANPLPDASDLLGLLREHHTRNGKHGITGMMLYADGTFLQVLEGPKEVIQERYDEICADRRFTNIQCLLSAPVAEREFTDWVMSFPQANLTDISPPSEGFSTFMDGTTPPSGFPDNPSRSQEALLYFRRLSDASPSAST